MTVHYLYNPDLYVYFKTISMGEGKTDPWIKRGLNSITWHMPLLLLSPQIVFLRRRVVTLVQVYFGQGVLNPLVEFN